MTEPDPRPSLKDRENREERREQEVEGSFRTLWLVPSSPPREHSSARDRQSRSRFSSTFLERGCQRARKLVMRLARRWALPRTRTSASFGGSYDWAAKCWAPTKR